MKHEKILEILKKYDPKKITIGVLGGHSGLDVCAGAKKYGFRTVAVCQKGRDLTYSKYYKTRVDANGVTKGCVDEVIIVDKFSDIVKPEVQKKLLEMNTVFVHNRYFWVYCNFEEIENDFMVPIFGNRIMVKLEERDQPKNQYYLLEKAGIRTPKFFKSAEEIDRLVIVKVNSAVRTYEREFFVASNAENFKATAEQKITKGEITREALDKATIEEFALGAQVNLNFFYSPLSGEVELMGTDMRRQTNLDGFLRLTSEQQNMVLQFIKPKMIETGHVAVTVKESLVEKIYSLGEKFVKTCEKECPPGMIGPFALQGAVVTEDNKEDFVIFDVSMRIPGSPGTRFTPYSGYMYGESIGYGERIAMEVKNAIKDGNLGKLLS